MTLALLSQPRREVYMIVVDNWFVDEYPLATQDDIVARSGLAPGVVALHLLALQESGLLLSTSFFGETRWFPACVPGGIPCADPPPSPPSPSP